MRKLLATALFSLALVGCASHTPYGNFVENPTGLNQQKIANDTIEQITSLYPPAKTRFEIKQATPDAFGTALVRGLRDKGYALLEFDPETAKAAQRTSSRPNESAPEVKVKTPVQQGFGLPIYYVFDQFSGTNMYRVTVMVGNESITRPYAQENGTVVPMGYWVRKE
ncbi:conjugal transfer protein TrbH [Vibrio parahaemolyticus]|nr:conjugal transfer protein TrbH [Vibrio parahaemolyticus]